MMDFKISINIWNVSIWRVQLKLSNSFTQPNSRSHEKAKHKKHFASISKINFQTTKFEFDKFIPQPTIYGATFFFAVLFSIFAGSLAAKNMFVGE